MFRRRPAWLAVGPVHGDDLGLRAVEKVHAHNQHATVLHLLGLVIERLTSRSAGRDFRVTDVHGNVVREIVA